MRRKPAVIMGLLLGIGLTLCIGAVATQRALDKEREVSLGELPAAVRATILAEAGGHAIREIEMETENGQVIYEAEVIVDGREVEFEIAPDGTLLGKEVEDE